MIRMTFLAVKRPVPAGIVLHLTSRLWMTGQANRFHGSDLLIVDFQGIMGIMTRSAVTHAIVV